MIAYINWQGGVRSHTLHVSEETDYVEQQESPVITHDTCPGDNEQGSESIVQRESPVRGVETPPPGDPHVVVEIRPGCHRSLCIARRRTMPPGLLSGRRQCTIGCGCSSPRVARRVTVRVPSIELD